MMNRSLNIVVIFLALGSTSFAKFSPTMNEFSQSSMVGKYNAAANTIAKTPDAPPPCVENAVAGMFDKTKHEPKLAKLVTNKRVEGQATK